MKLKVENNKHCTNVSRQYLMVRLNIYVNITEVILNNELVCVIIQLHFTFLLYLQGNVIQGYLKLGLDKLSIYPYVSAVIVIATNNTRFIIFETCY